MTIVYVAISNTGHAEWAFTSRDAAEQHCREKNADGADPDCYVVFDLELKDTP